jgi:hypothetical protein
MIASADTPVVLKQAGRLDRGCSLARHQNVRPRDSNILFPLTSHWYGPKLIAISPSEACSEGK